MTTLAENGYGLTGRRVRKGYAEGAEKLDKKVFDTLLFSSFATSAKPLRPLRPEVRVSP
jgi:hypothetical protein